MKDRYGNSHAAGLPYARGTILTSTEDDFAKLEHAWEIIREKCAKGGKSAVFNFTGLERGLPGGIQEEEWMDDDMSPALYGERLTELELEHMGGTPPEHDAILLNRLTAGILVAMMIMVKRGDTVIGVSAGYSHPAVTRAVAHCGGEFVDTVGVENFAKAIESTPNVSLVVLTRLAVTYDILPMKDITEVVRLARKKGTRIMVDDAGGARVGPAIFDQPRTLQLGVDIGVTGLDKYGTAGPRLGLLAGKSELVAKMRARAYEFGLEARQMLYPAVVRSLAGYKPERVRKLVTVTKEVGRALKEQLGHWVQETPVIIRLQGEDILEAAMKKAGLSKPPMVPYEATAALAMLLLRDYGMMTVHFAGMPPGTSALLIKFIPPETLERFGGKDAYAKAVAGSVDKLADMLRQKQDLRTLLFGGGKAENSEVAHRVSVGD
jgi:L-seryl-tRNA(Ser) seleniumtransferase